MTPESRELVRDAFAHVHDTWTPSRLAEGHKRMQTKRVRRRVVRGTAFVASALAVAFFVATRMPTEEGSARVARVATVTQEPTGELTDGALLLSDGSFAEPLSEETALAVESDAEARVHIALLDGAARFDVVRNPARTFVVSVRGLKVEVIGTRFEVEVEGARCHVRVLRGHVRVTWTRGRRDLLAGQSGLFPLTEDGGVTPTAVALPLPEPAPVPVPVMEDAPEAAPARAVEPHQSTRAPSAAPRVEPAASAPAASGDWRQLARSGDYESAFRASREQTVGTTIDDLWLAADASRLSGHPREAAAYLALAIAHHPSDARVHLASFTLGRLHLQLGQPRQAAYDFAQVERLDRRGVLVEQALAREVEAWSRAGDATRARERASSYLRRFPEGTYAERVRRFSTSP